MNNITLYTNFQNKHKKLMGLHKTSVELLELWEINKQNWNLCEGWNILAFHGA